MLLIFLFLFLCHAGVWSLCRYCFDTYFVRIHCSAYINMEQVYVDYLIVMKRLDVTLKRHHPINLSCILFISFFHSIQVSIWIKMKTTTTKKKKLMNLLKDNLLQRVNKIEVRKFNVYNPFIISIHNYMRYENDLVCILSFISVRVCVNHVYLCLDSGENDYFFLLTCQCMV